MIPASRSHPRRGLAALTVLGTAACLLGAGSAHAATPLSCIGGGGPSTALTPAVADARLGVTWGGDLPDVTVGKPFSIRPSVTYRLTNAYLEQLGEAGVLEDGDNNLGAITFWVKVKATNTVEQAQTMRAVFTGTYGRHNGTTQLGDRTRTTTRIHWDDAAGTATVRHYERDSASTTPTRVEQELAGSLQLDTVGVSWTPTSTAPVTFSVAPAGTTGALPVAAQWRRANATSAAPTLADPTNPTGSPATTVPDTETLEKAYPYGSVYARLSIGNASGGSWAGLRRVSLDCVPGDVSVSNASVGYSEVGRRAPAGEAPLGDSGRYTLLPASPEPLVVAQPSATAKPMTCLDGLGSFVGREVNPYEMRFRSAAPGGYTAGSPYAVDGVELDVTIDPVLVKGLYANLVTYESLPASQTLTKPLRIWVALEGRNTVEGVQRVLITSTWSAQFVDPDGEPNSGDELFPPAANTFQVPATTWTPTGAGPIEVGLAQPGTHPVIEGLTGFGHSGAAGAVYDAYPYGALYVRAETGRYGATLDCLRGDVEVTDPAIPRSNLGRRTPTPQIPTPVPAGAPPTGTLTNAGSGGRYTITPSAFSPIVVVPAAAVAPGPAPVAPASPAPIAAPAPPAAAAPAPAPTPTPTRVVARPTITTTSLKPSSTGRLAVRLGCPASATVDCAGRLKVRTVSRLALRRGARKALVALTSTRTYRVRPGAVTTYNLALGRDGRTVLRGRRALAGLIVAMPVSGKSVTRRVTLRR